MGRLSLLLLAGFLSSCTYLPIFDAVVPAGVRVVDHRDYIEMTPESGTWDPVGLMFWPGGLVEPAAYQASLGVFAARGYRVVIAKVPLNLAITSLNKGLALAQRLGGEWVAAGHSLGGTAAAWTVCDNPGSFRGLVLMASYPTDSKSLASWTGAVLSVYGENDGLAGPAEIASKKSLLPPEGTGAGFTRYYQINGGNHGQFGSYGTQEGDGQATITPEAQWTSLADQMVVFWGTL